MPRTTALRELYERGAAAQLDEDKLYSLLLRSTEDEGLAATERAKFAIELSKAKTSKAGETVT